MTGPVYYDGTAFLRKRPLHGGETYSELKARRARRWRAIKQGLAVLGAIGLAVLVWVGR